MSLAVRRFKVYLQVTLVVLLVGVVAIVLIKNRSNAVQFWFFGLIDEEKPVNVVWLIVWTASTSLVLWRILWFAKGLLRDMREIRRAKADKVREDEHKRLAADLLERQRQLDEKLKLMESADTKAGNEAKSSS